MLRQNWPELHSDRQRHQLRKTSRESGTTSIWWKESVRRPLRLDQIPRIRRIEDRIREQNDIVASSRASMLFFLSLVNVRNGIQRSPQWQSNSNARHAQRQSEFLMRSVGNGESARGAVRHCKFQSFQFPAMLLPGLPKSVVLETSRPRRQSGRRPSRQCLRRWPRPLRPQSRRSPRQHPSEKLAVVPGGPQEHW